MHTGRQSAPKGDDQGNCFYPVPSILSLVTKFRYSGIHALKFTQCVRNRTFHKDNGTHLKTCTRANTQIGENVRLLFSVKLYKFCVARIDTECGNAQLCVFRSRI